MANNILITGGAGFIGTHLTRHALAAGHRVSILDNLSRQIHGNEPSFVPDDRAKFIHGDVTHRADLERALQDVDTIVHLAAETGTGQSMYHIDRYYAVNVQGTALLFDILANSNHSIGNLVLASSRSIYGEGAYLCYDCEPGGARRFPVARSPAQLARHEWDPTCPDCGAMLIPTQTREDDPAAPASIYAATKLGQEDLVRVACRALGIDFSILRFQNVFGEGQSLRNPYTGILSIFSTRIRLGQSLPIFEDGEETRDFVHVEDVVTAVLSCVGRAMNGATFNVGSGRATSVMEVAKLLVEAMGANIDPHVTGHYRIGDIRHNTANITRLGDITGVLPQISLEAGLQRFCEWVQMQPIPEDLLEQANAELKARKLMS